MPTTRQSLLAIAAISLALVGFALYLQHAQEMLPCPKCVIQRYLFLGVALFSLIGAFAGKAKVFAGLALACTLGGLGVVARHLYVIANPGFSCGIDPLEATLNNIPTATLMPWLFQADGVCSGPQDMVLGLSVPQWSGVWFLLLTGALVWVLVRRAR